MPIVGYVFPGVYVYEVLLELASPCDGLCLYFIRLSSGDVNVQCVSDCMTLPVVLSNWHRQRSSRLIPQYVHS